eukprot:TRINITY_DN51560_c0_g1_i1.p1 TRINITY_DN51560_c0_g1~~TRINITY_DN51560_c0_g1_i1.p1  ORF type:complete len:119 (+),score=3.27 TRINITY_DN51560_c0_g1_i1:375-731(+)
MSFYDELLQEIGFVAAANFFCHLGRALGCKLPNDPYMLSLEARVPAENSSPAGASLNSSPGGPYSSPGGSYSSPGGPYSSPGGPSLPHTAFREVYDSKHWMRSMQRLRGDPLASLSKH